jgi:hypothetical protein
MWHFTSRQEFTFSEFKQSLQLPLENYQTMRHVWCILKLAQSRWTKQTPWSLVRKRTIPTNRPSTFRRNLVPTFADRRVSPGQRGGSPTVVDLSFLDRSRYFFFQVAPHLSSRSWLGLVPHPLVSRKFGSAGNLTQDLWVSSQEFWPSDH